MSTFNNKLNCFQGKYFERFDFKFFDLCVLKWDDDSELLETMILALIVLWIFGFNWAMCGTGERVANQFEQFGVEFNRCEWNKLPIKMQRMYLIFLLEIQQPKILRSFGGIKCTSETFKQVCISYK